MVVKIRNINSIQVFHATCEVASVSRAARFLNISQSSVSYHIKKLETDLGVALFRRNADGLTLTEDGSALFKYVDRGLVAIQTGLERVANRADLVKVALLPMFASRWLSPRLGGLLESVPGIHLSIQSHNNTYARMANPEGFADLGIQWGRGNWNNFEITRLWPEKLVVVCSPDYLRAHPIRRPSDLEGCMLLHVDDNRMWEEWLAANKLELATSQPQMMLEDRHFQLSSTINGLGVSLFASWLVQSELERGDLVNPFNCTFDTSFAYHLIVPKANEMSQSSRVFRDWLLEVSGDVP
jgi:LysR family glycine cleavage system transcriptional activator